VYSPETKSFTQIVTGILPAWFADSKRLVFMSGAALHVVDTATKKAHQIFGIPGEVVTFPGLTKDNRYLYYQHQTTDADIWVATIKELMAKPAAAAPADAVAAFDRLVATRPGVERKGAAVPYTSLNGHMFSYLAKSGVLALRLPEPERSAFLKKY